MHPKCLQGVSPETELSFNSQQNSNSRNCTDGLILRRGARRPARSTSRGGAPGPRGRKAGAPRTQSPPLAVLLDPAAPVLFQYLRVCWSLPGPGSWDFLSAAESVRGWLLAAGANKATVWVQSPSGQFTLLQPEAEAPAHFWSRARGKGGGRTSRGGSYSPCCLHRSRRQHGFLPYSLLSKEVCVLEFAFSTPSASTHQAPVHVFRTARHSLCLFDQPSFIH